jgi:hypothetical protein
VSTVTTQTDVEILLTQHTIVVFWCTLQNYIKYVSHSMWRAIR